jgi:hypothetical protein
MLLRSTLSNGESDGRAGGHGTHFMGGYRRSGVTQSLRESIIFEARETLSATRLCLFVSLCLLSLFSCHDVPPARRITSVPAV